MLLEPHDQHGILTDLLPAELLCYEAADVGGKQRQQTTRFCDEKPQEYFKNQRAATSDHSHLIC